MLTMLPLACVITNITGSSFLSVVPLMSQLEPEQSTDSDIPDPLPCPAKASCPKAETDIIVTARNTIESDVIVCLREFIIISSQ